MTPVCKACSADAVVHWSRRPTAAELSDLLAAETARRADIVALSDPDNPPAFAPMPTTDCFALPVYACAAHGLTIDLAAHVHANTCTAPNPASLPHCDCTPESLPAPEIVQAGSPTDLPIGW